MKRKAEIQSSRENGKGILKKRVKTEMSTKQVQENFRKGLFAKDVLSKYNDFYANSEPYKHCVITSLTNDDLLRSVRNEIREHVSFAPKETDIYKIHQSGDLANLDGLDDGALEKLPSMLRLRDAMYSSEFREYLSTITGSGKLSGRKTDMAINVYTPGCHLLCHDDVIGSRRISYILYLVDPDIPWKEEWGGALRLFPTKTMKDVNGVETVIPEPDSSKSIPPAWNQLSFFAVQPGQSFHDVEEVYHAESTEQLKLDGGRIRMAISGWFHIPQLGEDGYIEGEEEKWGKNSSLMQLQGNPALYDCPKPQPIIIEEESKPIEEKSLGEADFEFLLKYISPTYLTPDTLEEIAERFMDLSSVTLDGLLSKRFSARVKEYIEKQEAQTLPLTTSEIETGSWKVARPPHKHRFLYFQGCTEDDNPIKELTEVLLPSSQFRTWLELATQCSVTSYDILARRFRRGLDYSLAKSHDIEPRLEISLGLTPTPGWCADEEEGDEKPEVEANEKAPKAKSEAETDATGKPGMESPEDDDVGGHEVYMAGDEEEDEDAAIYKATAEEEDNVLFSMPASWNKMSIVLRDSGVLKFVKYISKNAKGDRWDVSGAFGVKIDEEGEDEDEEEVTTEEEGKGKDEADGLISLEDSEEETFNGFSDSNDSDSD